MSLIDYIKEDMRLNKKTQEELANDLGISLSTLYNLLKKKHRPKNQTLRKIAKYYDLDIREVVIMNDLNE